MRIKKFLNLTVILAMMVLAIFPSLSQANDLSGRLKGRILLRVEDKGQAWYINPLNSQRYYLGRPVDAFEIMRSLGLGINNKDFDSFKGKAPSRLSGRILIKVEDLGKAYYVNPLDLQLHYLGRPADAFSLMRSLGLGITDSNLNTIAKAADSRPEPDGEDTGGPPLPPDFPDGQGGEEIADMNLSLVAEGLTSPVALTSAHDNSGRLFVADQTGKIRIIDRDGQLMTEPFLDLTNKIVNLNSSYDERGLLGLAFHPEYRTNSRFFVYYSAPLRSVGPSGYDHTNRLSEFRVLSDNSNIANIDSEKILLEVDQPQANHNGGQIAFGPDGFLYVTIGDGGGANDTGTGHVAGGNAQDINQLHGKILRLNIDAPEPYAIPGDNPFLNIDGRDEIFALGFRNPFHFSFDAAGSRDLIASDAGQNLWEEINIVAKGGNYGWNIKEGRHCFDPNNPDVSPSTCSDQGKTLIDPVLEYKNIDQPDGQGTVVIGGYVYRGGEVPGLDGKYIFGDWSAASGSAQGKIFIADMSGQNWTFREANIADRPNNLGEYLLGFGQDQSNELYILTKASAGPTGQNGKIYKLTAVNGSDEPSQQIEEIRIKNLEFMPREVTVKAGTRVRWINEDMVAHNVYNQVELASGDIPPGGQYEMIFTEKGEYGYICSIHPSMSGRIIVE